MAEEKIGLLLGFSKRWYPLSNEIFVRVLIDNDVIIIPIDYRKKTHIEKEYPVDSKILLACSENGEWHILSRHLNHVTLKKTILY